MQMTRRKESKPTTTHRGTEKGESASTKENTNSRGGKNVRQTSQEEGGLHFLQQTQHPHSAGKKTYT